MSAVISESARKAQMLSQQALSHLNQGDTERAEALLAQALSAVPEHADALQLMGIVRRLQGRPEVAENYYRRSLATAPDQPQVHHNLGNLLKSRQQYDEAVAELR